ncbi:MAG: hypothetical protein ACK40D_09015 [Cyanobacteriota bacterium]
MASTGDHGQDLDTTARGHRHSGGRQLDHPLLAADARLAGRPSAGMPRSSLRRRGGPGAIGLLVP